MDTVKSQQTYHLISIYGLFMGTIISSPTPASKWPLTSRPPWLLWRWLTFDLSTSLVVMTMTPHRSCHTIRHMSTMVACRQPCVAMYCFFGSILSSSAYKRNECLDKTFYNARCSDKCGIACKVKLRRQPCVVMYCFWGSMMSSSANRKVHVTCSFHVV